MRRFPILAALLVAYAATSAWADDLAARVKPVIEQGRLALHKAQTENVAFTDLHPRYQLGGLALVTWALLEAGTPTNDPVIQRLADQIRVGTRTDETTYSLACCIFALDRVGDPIDRVLIRQLTYQLGCGMAKDAGWTYNAVSRAAVPEGRDPPDVVPDLRLGEHVSDNSNTQFGVMGVWVGRRYGMKVDPQLRAIEQRFRQTRIRTRGGDSWEYSPTGDGRGQRDTMTAAGLVALAVGKGVERAQRSPDTDDKLPPPTDDHVIHSAMGALGESLKQVASKSVASLDDRVLYYFWSVERVGGIYGLERIGGAEWYRIGAEKILQLREPDGWWHRGYEIGGRDPQLATSLALLFLTRANVAKDLTVALKPKVEPSVQKSVPPREPSVQKSAPGSRVPTEPEPKADLPTPTPAPSVAVKPTTPAVDEAQSLAEQIAKLPAGEQVKRMQLVRDAKGAANTDALRLVIPKLSGEAQRLARDYLAERLARMTPATLRDRLKDSDAEMRRAAALACGLRNDKSLVGDLVPVVADTDSWVSRAAGVALKMLTGQDFGPRTGASIAERAKAAADWKRWNEGQRH